MPASRIRWTSLFIALVAATACQGRADGHIPEPSPQGDTSPVRVLMLTATTGYRHDAIPEARNVMNNLASSTGAFTVTMTEDVSSITPESLQTYDVLFFGLTTGELPFSNEQKSAILQFVRGGKGFMGVHSASDTLYEWPEYGELVGAYFREHPWTQDATVVVEDPSHPASAGLGPSFSIRDEYYVFRENPRPRVRVLLRLDASSVNSSGDHPLAWSQTVGDGRSYYNALGHFPETWTDARFQQQILGAIRWLGRVE